MEFFHESKQQEIFLFTYASIIVGALVLLGAVFPE
ncbi:hypothetical protein JOD18_003237 [Gracilibacillus alcaliphilus]|nr:hypothetical protein [Gracilibacillus alcaliphilus]